VLGSVLPPVLAADSDGENQKQLNQLRGQIEQLQEKLNSTRGQRDSVREEVRDLERRIGVQLNTLRKTNARLKTNSKKLADLNVRAMRERANLNTHQKQLAHQIYTAYRMGRQEYPKMLLNQENPAQFARVVSYYQYLNRARSDRITHIQASLTRMTTLESEIKQNRQELEKILSEQQAQKQALEKPRARRNELLANLNREVQNQSNKIQSLRGDEKRLKQLVEELNTVLPEAQLLPPDGKTPFAKLRGRLSLPTQGRILARFGGSKNVGNLKWRGLLISGKEGQNVVSVYRGRVVFADWLRGFGLLLILDHGDGYMTLYGHNQSLYKGVGDLVEAGETVASLGNTGDTSHPGLYFEIRQNGEPRDPLIWCKAR